MENPFGNTSAFHALGLVVSVRVEGLVGHYMVFQDGLEIFLTVIAEEEAIYSGAKLLEREVGRSEEGPSDMIGSVVQGLDEAGLGQSKLERAEFSRKQLNDLDSVWRWYQNAVHPVNNTIGSELRSVRLSTSHLRVIVLTMLTATTRL